MDSSLSHLLMDYIITVVLLSDDNKGDIDTTKEQQCQNPSADGASANYTVEVCTIHEVWEL